MVSPLQPATSAFRIWGHESMDGVEKLPSFSNPPLDEVAASMQFANLPVRSIDIASLHALVAKNYPDTLDVPPLPPTFEGIAGFSANPFAVNALNSLLPRTWFVSPDGQHVIQFQADRLIVNWRTQPNGGQYPRYAEVRRRFISAYEALRCFCAERGIADPAPNQCDLTYYNKVALPQDANWGDLDRLLRCVSFDHGPEWKRRFSVGQLSLSADVGEGDSALSRLHLECVPTQIDPMRRAWALNVAVRGRPAEPTFQAVLAFLDGAHDEIVKCFASVTVESMQQLWGRLT